MGELTRLFEQYKSDEGRLFHKIPSYANAYEWFLADFVGKPVTLAEFGIDQGGSLQVWRYYLGPQARIIGIDKESHTCYEEDRISCMVIDQEDKEALSTIPPVDIFIDDASHIMKHQIDTFEAVFPKMNHGGVYFIEDTHTSYREQYSGGYKREGTLVEYFKSMTDSLNYLEDESIIPHSSITSLIDSITFYRSLIVVKHK